LVAGTVAVRQKASPSFTSEEDEGLLTAVSLDDAEAASLLSAASSAASSSSSSSSLSSAVSSDAELDVASLSALHDSIGDDLSSDADLTDSLDRLLTGSETDETDEVSGEAYGDEPNSNKKSVTPPTTNTITEVNMDGTSRQVTSTKPQHKSVPAVPSPPPKPSVPTKTERVPAKPDMNFKELIVEKKADSTIVTAVTTDNTAATTVSATVTTSASKGPITPLKSDNPSVAVPVPVKAAKAAADQESEHHKSHHPTKHGKKVRFVKHTKKADADSDEENEEGEEEADADDVPRFMAERAMNEAIAEFSATPQQLALESQGAADAGVTSLTTSMPATADRIKAAVWVVLCIGAAVIVFEAGTYLLDYHLKNSHIQMDKMLSKTYKALMILGLVSFLLVCYARLDWLSRMFGSYSPNLLYDLLIVMFVMGILYTLVMIGLVGWGLYQINSYKAIEQKYRTEADLNRLESQMNKERDTYYAQGCCKRAFTGCFQYRNVKDLEFAYHYLHIKQQFVRQHHRKFFAPMSAAMAAQPIINASNNGAAGTVAAAPSSAAISPAVSYQNFEFHIYLRKSMQTVMEEVAAVHWQVWCAVFVIILLNALRMLAFKSVDASSFVYISVIALWVVMCFAAALVYSMYGATEELSEHYALYLPEREASDTPVEAKESDDPDDELLREVNHIQGGGCCGKACACTQHCKTVGCCSAPTKQQEIFWCKTPSSVSKGIQIAVLLTCLITPAYIIDMADFVSGPNMTVRIVVNVLLAIPPLVCLFALIPMIIPRFIVATSVASMSRMSALRQTVHKLNSQTYRRKKMDDDKLRKTDPDLRSPSEGVLSSDDEEDSDNDNDNDTKSIKSDIDLENPSSPQQSRPAAAVSMTSKAQG